MQLHRQCPGNFHTHVHTFQRSSQKIWQEVEVSKTKVVKLNWNFQRVEFKTKNLQVFGQHVVAVVSLGTELDSKDQIEFLKQLRVISDNAKLGR